MVRKPPTRTSIAVVAFLLVGFIVWTLLVFNWPPLEAFDRRRLAPPLDLASSLGQIAAAVSLITLPALEYLALFGVALWALRHRFRQLAVAVLLVIILGWGGSYAIKLSLRRLRPEQGLDLLTVGNYSYPSGHLVSAVAAGIVVGAVFAVTRQRLRARLLWGAGAGLLVIVVAIDRWLLGAHFVSDIIGGTLLGGLVATLSLVVAGVQVPVPTELVTELVRAKTPTVDPANPKKRCAVIFNPIRIADIDVFKRHVNYELKSRGWHRTLWLETTEEDPGREMTRRAVKEKVDLVLGAGGDGTIRVICSELAATGIPFGLIPAGTGNLLARNIGIPLDEAAALSVAFDGLEKDIDLVKITVDGRNSDHFAVMAGIGIDAMIMQGARPDLKKAVGPAAYFVSAARNANHPALFATIHLDGRQALRRRAHVIVVGNVGYLTANIPLIPDARADDGLLDVLVASPRSVRDWVRLTARVLTRQRGRDHQLVRLTGRAVKITVDRPDHYQMDGDPAGECRSLEAEVRPGALKLRVPRPPRRETVPTGAEPATAESPTSGEDPTSADSPVIADGPIVAHGNGQRPPQPVGQPRFSARQR
jgi:diacylglycerol kinase (ATP)